MAPAAVALEEQRIPDAGREAGDVALGKTCSERALRVGLQETGKRGSGFERLDRHVVRHGHSQDDVRPGMNRFPSVDDGSAGSSAIGIASAAVRAVNCLHLHHRTRGREFPDHLQRERNAQLDLRRLFRQTDGDCHVPFPRISEFSNRTSCRAGARDNRIVQTFLDALKTTGGTSATACAYCGQAIRPASAPEE